MMFLTYFADGNSPTHTYDYRSQTVSGDSNNKPKHVLDEGFPSKYVVQTLTLTRAQAHRGFAIQTHATAAYYKSNHLPMLVRIFGKSKVSSWFLISSLYSAESRSGTARKFPNSELLAWFVNDVSWISTAGRSGGKGGGGGDGTPKVLRWGESLEVSITEWKIESLKARILAAKLKFVLLCCCYEVCVVFGCNVDSQLVVSFGRSFDLFVLALLLGGWLCCSDCKQSLCTSRVFSPGTNDFPFPPKANR